MRNFLRIGEIISLHGIKGEVKVYPATDNIKRFDDLTTFFITSSKDASDTDFKDIDTYEKENVKYLKNTVILKIKGFDSIEASTKLIRKNIYVSRDNAISLGKDEYYVIDLINMPVYDDSAKIGEVVDIMKTKANDILVVKYQDKEVLIPLVDEYVTNVDLKQNKVTVKNIEGLI